MEAMGDNSLLNGISGPGMIYNDHLFGIHNSETTNTKNAVSQFQ